MKKFLSLLLLLTVFFSLPIFGQAQTDYSQLKIALISDTIGTEQFILQAYNALMSAAEKHGFKATSIECTDTAAWAEKSRNAAVAGYDLLIGVGWVAAEPFSELADEFPDTSFAVIDTVASNERIRSIAFNTVEGSYVMGAMVASAFKEEKQFGYIGNFQNQSNFEYRYGFVSGLRSVIPEAQLLINFANSYSDTSVTYNLAMQQAAAGCKFIMGSVANSANQGIYQAALELAQKGTPIYTSGLSVDQTTADNPYIVTGLTKNTGIATNYIIDEFLSGQFAGGKQILGFADNAFQVVGISFEANYRNEEIITDEVLAAGQAAAEAIRSGDVKLEVPLEGDYKE